MLFCGHVLLPNCSCYTGHFRRKRVTTMMPRVPIAPQGPEFSRLVYGTWRMLKDQPTAQEINRRLQVCAELGITTIDTAEIYGVYEVEAALGAALALSPGLRDKLEIVTKAG